MNRQEKLIVILLVIALGAWMFSQSKMQASRAAEMRRMQEEAAAAAATNAVAPAASSAIAEASLSSAAAGSAATTTGGTAQAAEQEPASSVPEATATISSGKCEITLTSKGGAVKSAKLHDYRRSLELPEEERVVIDLSGDATLALGGVAGLGKGADFDIAVADDGRSATLTATAPSGLRLVRTIAFTNDYRLAVSDTFSNTSPGAVAVHDMTVSIGEMASDGSKDDMLLAVDLRAPNGRRAEYPQFSKMQGNVAQMAFGGSGGGGCSSARIPDSAPLTGVMKASDKKGRSYADLEWAAARSQFFVQVVTPAEPAATADVRVTRNESTQALILEKIGATMHFKGFSLNQGESVTRDYDYYVGPRKMSLLRALGKGQVHIMQFGFWRLFCEWLLQLLNALHAIPFLGNYGVSIILLTLIVRLALLPVSKRGTESMKRMAQIQPKIKEIQAMYKDDPQQQQQETMRLYSEHKVNPFSSCLPMLIQLPVFFALFTVLRSAVELRFESFLWVADLSAPENLFADVLPIPLNILPILMAVTMTLQSKLTPMSGDAQQQKMMMIFMPIMMMVFCYRFPAALGLYWTFSQLLGIIGLLYQKRKSRANGAQEGVEIIPPEKRTRQMRRAESRA